MTIDNLTIDKDDELLTAVDDCCSLTGYDVPQTEEQWNDLANVVGVPLARVRKQPAETLHDYCRLWNERRQWLRMCNGQAPASAAIDIVRVDDGSIAMVKGKKVHLGRDTQLSRMFWLLADSFGHTVSRTEAQAAVDEGLIIGSHPSEVKKAGERLRQVWRQLRKALRDSQAEEHIRLSTGGECALLPVVVQS